MRLLSFPKLAAKHRMEHSYVEVTRIMRQHPDTWVSDVEYSYGQSTWTESVTFKVVPFTRRTSIVSVIDTDYPDDRALRIVIEKDADMASVIINFLVAGRW